MIALSPAWSALPALLATVVASISLILLKSPGRLPTAHPNVRSLHHRPVPRGGGLAIWSGWLAGTVWLATPQPWLAPVLLVLVAFAPGPHFLIHGTKGSFVKFGMDPQEEALKRGEIPGTLYCGGALPASAVRESDPYRAPA